MTTYFVLYDKRRKRLVMDRLFPTIAAAERYAANPSMGLRLPKDKWGLARLTAQEKQKLRRYKRGDLVIHALEKNHKWMCPVDWNA